MRQTHLANAKSKDGIFKDIQSKNNQTKIPNGQLFLSFDKIEAKSSDCRGCRPVK
jgi:hypothetical protein